MAPIHHLPCKSPGTKSKYLRPITSVMNASVYYYQRCRIHENQLFKIRKSSEYPILPQPLHNSAICANTFITLKKGTVTGKLNEKACAFQFLKYHKSRPCII
jgi:hypothetical protein